MADDIAIPVSASRTVATDEIGGRNFQLMKQVDGTEGSLLPSKIDGTGALRVAAGYVAGGGTVSDAVQASYASGHAVGAAIQAAVITSAQHGLYELCSVDLVSLGGDPVANIAMGIASADPGWADGDAVAPLPAAISSSVLAIAAADLTSQTMFGSDAVHFHPTKPLRFEITGNIWVALVATGTIASPITGPLAVAVTLYRIAASF